MEGSLGKRQFTRVGFKIYAAVTFEGATFEGRVDNISLHGVYITEVTDLPAGSPAEICITLNPMEPEVVIRVTGVVVRSGSEGTAFEFNRMDVDSFIHLRKLVSYAICDGDTIMGEFASYVDHRLHEQRDDEE